MCMRGGDEDDVRMMVSFVVDVLSGVDLRSLGMLMMEMEIC